MPYSALKIKGHFVGKYSLHLQGRRISQARNRRKISLALLATCVHAGFLLGLYIDPEDGGDMFIRNFG
jgi:hypothetical protein